MFYGEHLNANELEMRCPCGIVASTEIFDKGGRSQGWFCRTHASRVRAELRKQEKLAKAILRKKTP